jgi:hypothetical protein
VEIEEVGGRTALLAGASESWEEFVGVSTVLFGVVLLTKEGMIRPDAGVMLASRHQTVWSSTDEAKHEENEVMGIHQKNGSGCEDVH